MSSWEKELTPLSDLFRIIVEIGEGAYGKVLKGQSIQTNELVAIKKINRSKLMLDGFPYSSIREIALLKSVKHQNIVSLIDVVTDRNLDVYLVFDYCEYDLDYLIRKYAFTEIQIKSYMRQLLIGLFVLHQRYIFHRDLKPQNILVKATNVVEIADFGLAKQISKNDIQKRKKPMTHTVITLYYRPLEVFFKVPEYGPEVDVWSMGCIFYELICGRPLFLTSKFDPKAKVSVNEISVIQQIFSICGYPSEEDWPEWKDLSEKSEIFQSAKIANPGNLDAYLTKTLPPKYLGAKPLLLGMLQYNPAKRTPISELILDKFLHNYNGCLNPENIPPINFPEKCDSKLPQKQ